MKSGIQGLIIAFLGTLLIFSLVKNGIYEKMPKMRFLSNRTMSEIREEMCSKSSSEVKHFYEKTGPNYDFNPPESKLLYGIIKNMINSSSSQDIGQQEVKSYFNERPLYIFILILFIILIILWIPYILCVCCKCCCLVPESCLGCSKFYIFICIGLCALALINCFIGYSKNGNIVDGVYGLGCTILKVEQHLLEGDEYKSERPFWMGLNPIVSKLYETSQNISDLGRKSKSIDDEFQSKITLTLEEFKSNLTEEYNNRNKQEVSNPDPEKENTITPAYLNEYGPPEKGGKILNYIYEEIKGFYSKSSYGVSSITSIINTATEQFTEINKTIEAINTNLIDNINEIDNSIASKINEYDDTFDEIQSKSRTYMNLFFTLNLIIALAVGVSLIFILMCKKGLLMLCLSWFVLYIFMLLTFFLGALFGLIGSFVQDASSGIHYLINNLDEIDLDAQSKDIAQICINGNGSLAQSSLIPNFDHLSIIDNVYSLESLIDVAIQNITIYTPESIEIVNNKYDELLRNKSQLFDIIEVLESVRKLTDKNYPDSSVSNYADEWEISEQDCQYYEILRPDGVFPDNILSEKEYCLVITEWPREKIEQRYSQNEKILSYYDSINKYMDDTKKLIGEVKAKNEEFNKTFEYIGKLDLDLLEQTKDNIRPLRESYEEIVGDSSIFEILNCKFLKRDVNKIMQELYDSFGQTFLTTSTLFILISVYELGMTFFILLIMKAYGKKTKSEDIEKIK